MQRSFIERDVEPMIATLMRVNEKIFLEYLIIIEDNLVPIISYYLYDAGRVTMFFLFTVIKYLNLLHRIIYHQHRFNYVFSLEVGTDYRVSYYVCF